MSKFKVGDKVRIRKDLEAGQYYNEFRANDLMAAKRGEEAVIKHTFDRYYLLADGMGYAWTDGMIEPIEEKTYPRVMLVSDHDCRYVPRVVIAHKLNRYIAWRGAKTLEEAEDEVETYAFRYAKELKENEPEEEVVEMTMDDICKALGKTVKIIK